jgi:hypothetical protein
MTLAELSEEPEFKEQLCQSGCDYCQMLIQGGDENFDILALRQQQFNDVLPHFQGKLEQTSMTGLLLTPEDIQ